MVRVCADCQYCDSPRDLGMPLHLTASNIVHDSLCCHCNVCNCPRPSQQAPPPHTTAPTLSPPPSLPLSYMAPEVFRHEPYNNKVDVYAYGMIVYYLFEGVPPFYDMDPIAAARRDGVDSG